jgi:outer membrane receptor protein involved in Fe transport
MANRKIERAVRVALIAASTGAVAYLPSASAQDQELEQIVVTGSRIPQPNLEGQSPVTVIGSQEVRLQGVTQVEDLINNLPQAFADQGGNISNGASGTATVNLRNLGADRTLVLVNGKRLPAGSPRGPVAPDLNQIPAPLIERVEVLTGGASAVYGSDAVAGVVNFIMNDNFEGVQFDVNYSFYQHHNDNPVDEIVRSRGFAPAPNQVVDGNSYELSMLLGSNFADGKGNATLFVGYRNIDALLQSERDYSACALGSNAAGFTCGGSSTSFPGRFFTPNDDATVADAQGNIRPFTAADVYNYGPLNYYQRPDERYAISAFAHYDVSDSARIYTELSFHDDSTVAQIAPSGLFGWPQDPTLGVSCGNPLLSQAWRDSLGCVGANPDQLVTGLDGLLILRRNVEGGGRQDDLRHSSYRGVIGLKGTVGENWNYDVFGQYGTVIYSQSYLNDFSVSRANRAMDVVADPATGRPVCRSVLNGTDTDCVPYNIWSLGGVTPEALAYLQTPGFQRGDTTQTVVGASLSSDLGAYGIKSPMATQGIGVAFGAEYRQEGLTFTTDQAFTSGDLFGQGGPTIGLAGDFNVMDLFGELRLPLIEDVFMADSLSISASYRYSDYSNPIDESTNTYGVGLDWAPIESFKVRGSYQRAVRAPNVIELFQAAGLALYDNDEDPCAGRVPTRSLAECQRTGVTAAQYGFIQDNTAGQYNFIQGGNLDLIPETSDSYTVGFVFMPTFLDGFSITVDYFSIKVEDAIANLPPVSVLTECLDTGSAALCDLIQRDALGTLWATPDAFIVGTNVNIGKYETSGIDTDITYTTTIGDFGGLTFNLVGTYLDEYLVNLGFGEYDCAGLYGPTCGTPLPEWRHKARVTWMTPWNLDLSLSWRYIDAVLLDRTDPNPLLVGVVREVDRELDAQNYLDIAASWTVYENYTLRAGINNITDTDPPLSAQVGAGFGNGNTYPQVYDALGRSVFLSLTAKF